MTKYLSPVLETTGHGPLTTEWTNSKVNATWLLILGPNKIRLCFANRHDSWSKEEIFRNCGQGFFNKGKEGCHNRQCASNRDMTLEQAIDRDSHSSMM